MYFKGIKLILTFIIVYFMSKKNRQILALVYYLIMRSKQTLIIIIIIIIEVVRNIHSLAFIKFMENKQILTFISGYQFNFL